MFSINLGEQFINDAEHLTLHSTMFSINRSVNCSERAGDCALHSTMFSINLKWLQRRTIVIDLYIPLCFLLIVNQLALDLPKFTLHSTMFSINLTSHSIL